MAPAAEVQQAESCVRAEPAVGKIVGDTLHKGQSLALAILAQETYPLVDALPDGGVDRGNCLDHDLASAHGIKPKYCAQQLGSAGAHDASNPDDLAPAQSQANA